MQLCGIVKNDKAIDNAKALNKAFQAIGAPFLADCSNKRKNGAWNITFRKIQESCVTDSKMTYVTPTQINTWFKRQIGKPFTTFKSKFKPGQENKTLVNEYLKSFKEMQEKKAQKGQRTVVPVEVDSKTKKITKPAEIKTTKKTETKTTPKRTENKATPKKTETKATPKRDKSGTPKYQVKGKNGKFYLMVERNGKLQPGGSSATKWEGVPVKEKAKNTTKKNTPPKRTETKAPPKRTETKTTPKKTETKNPPKKEQGDNGGMTDFQKAMLEQTMKIQQSVA